MKTTDGINGQDKSGMGTASFNDGISVKLRQYYQTVEQEHIPDNLLSLLDKLEKAEEASLKRSKDSSDE
jgi:hypothetical protein